MQIHFLLLFWIVESSSGHKNIWCFALDIGFVVASPNRHYGRAFISLFFFWSVRQIVHWIKICSTTSVSCQFEHSTSGQNQLTANLKGENKDY
jgi:hypothetical protein